MEIREIFEKTGNQSELEKDEEIEKIISGLPKLNQRQYSTLQQLKYVNAIATRLGLYDASDVIRRSIGQ